MNKQRTQFGFSLVEIMIAILLGLVIGYSILQIYMAQTQIYKASNSQDLILNTENAISNLVTPTLRAAGFLGCSTIQSAISNLNAGGPPPLGTFNTTPSMVVGYSGDGPNITLTTVNAANDGTASNWTPTLTPSLVGQVIRGNDVIIVLGGNPGSHAVGINTITSGSNSFTVQSMDGTNAASGQFGAVSDCTKTVIFQITGATTTTITHNVSNGILENAASAFPVSFQAGSQFIPLQQTAFFVAQGQGGQSTLMRAVLNGNAWTFEPLVPGIEIMKIQYGIGTNGTVSQYVAANAVTDWSRVYAIRMGFLIAGQVGSGSLNATSYNVLNNQITVPADNRLRHVFEMTVHLRNAVL